MTTTELRILSWNLHGLRDDRAALTARGPQGRPGRDVRPGGAEVLPMAGEGSGPGPRLRAAVRRRRRYDGRHRTAGPPARRRRAVRGAAAVPLPARLAGPRRRGCRRTEVRWPARGRQPAPTAAGAGAPRPRAAGTRGAPSRRGAADVRRRRHQRAAGTQGVAVPRGRRPARPGTGHAGRRSRRPARRSASTASSPPTASRSSTTAWSTNRVSSGQVTTGRCSSPCGCRRARRPRRVAAPRGTPAPAPARAARGTGRCR